MIAVDTSALIEIALDADLAEVCRLRLVDAEQVIISAGTLHEALVMAERRGLAGVIQDMLATVRARVMPLDEPAARTAADAYARYGKGIHPASLNLADCYAYALARSNACPLLYVGDDFDLTDVERALP